jgi:hypothetical protein
MIVACYILLALCFIFGAAHQSRSAAGISAAFVTFNVLGALDPLYIHHAMGSLMIYLSGSFEQYAIDNIFERSKFIAANTYLIFGAFFIVSLFPSNRYYKRVLWLIAAGVATESISLILWDLERNYGLLNVAYNMAALYIIYDRERRGNIISTYIDYAMSICRGYRVGSHKWKA